MNFSQFTLGNLLIAILVGIILGLAAFAIFVLTEKETYNTGSSN